MFEIGTALVILLGLYFVINFLTGNVFIILPDWLVSIIVLGIAVKCIIFVIGRRD